MLKKLCGSLSIVCLLGACAQQTSMHPTATASASRTSSAATGSVDTASPSNDQDYETVFVPPPVGSLLGGGSVRVAKKSIAGNDERALDGNISRLNAAAGSRAERPFVVQAVSQVTGVSAQALQAQQDRLQMRFGELCAINAMAHGNMGQVQAIAGMRAKGRTWTDLAAAHGTSVAGVVQVVRNANDLASKSYYNNADRQQGGNRKLEETGVRNSPRPGN